MCYKLKTSPSLIPTFIEKFPGFKYGHQFLALGLIKNLALNRFVNDEMFDWFRQVRPK